MAGSSITVRPAVIKDAETIHAALLGLAEALGEAGKIRSTPNDIRRYGFGERPAFEVLIAEVDGVFAGLSLFFPSFSTWFGQPGVYVQDLFVEPRFRGQRVADLLIRETARAAQAQGGAYVRLAVDADNANAQSFYRRVGMKWSSQERIYVARYEDFDALCDIGPE